MGSPTVLQPFTTKEVLDMLEDAKTKTKEDMIQALDRFRLSLLPMVQWLDAPINEWAGGHGLWPDRALFVFEPFGSTLPPIGLDRSGFWISAHRHKKGTVSTKRRKSIDLVDWIAKARVDILTATPLPMKEEVVRLIEALLGDGRIIVQAAFLCYLEFGLANIEKALRRREERLRIMRTRIENLDLFRTAADPIVKRGTMRLPQYAVFRSTGRGCSRVSGSYLIERHAAERVAEKGDSNYYVSDDTSPVDSLSKFPWRLGVIVEETSESGCCGRDPISEDERQEILAFASRISA